MTDFILEDISRDKLIEIVKEEQKVRYSKGIQEAYTQQYYALKTENFVRINIEQEIQKFILRKFGFNDNDESLKEYWKIPSMYWNDEEVKNSLFYMKLNIFQYSKVNVEDNLIDVNLIDYQTNNTVSLESLQSKNRPLIILAGSMT